ncbi:MAG: hypothetical protein JW807_02535 [Spirochaetes bacterium]|nr:hypothetical protein [Spirochaetota bacterium]
MKDTIKQVIIPHAIGLAVMIVGWYISIADVGLSTRLKTYQEIRFISIPTILGLILIFAGAYFPRIWAKIKMK